MYCTVYRFYRITLESLKARPGIVLYIAVKRENHEEEIEAPGTMGPSPIALQHMCADNQRP